MIDKLKENYRNLKLRQRMLLIYAIGCFLPLIFVIFFMFNNTRNSLISMELRDERQKMIRIKDEIEASMDFAVDLSEKLYFDTELQMVGLPTLSGGEDMLFGYRDFNKLTEYARKYYGQISSISIYVEQGTVDRVDNKNYKLITDTIKEKPWYINTMKQAGLPSWSYLTDLGTHRRSIRLTRILYTRADRREIGIISISLNPELTEGYINETLGFSIMTLNGTDLVHTNFDITPQEEEQLLTMTGTTETVEAYRFRGLECYISGVPVNPRFSEDYYEILNIRPVGDVDSLVLGNAGKTVLPVIIAVIIMLIAILHLYRWFTRRITALGRAMHKVTEKNYDTEETGISDVNDEIYDIYTDMNRMVTDMQRLSEAAANERIQKEQLYSRQRDVEFKMLTTQINPHFLYNTLENIRMLAMINHETEIEDISVRLTRLLRSSLEAGGELKTLAWEMDKVDCYLKIQDYRFGDRITAEMDFDPEMAEQVMVMPFVVQPFVENAYVHAMEEMEEGGRITVRAVIKDSLHLLIEDNGCGMTREELAEIHRSMEDMDELDRTHIGIANVNQRIRLRFGEAYGVVFSSVEGKGTTVEIHMPLIRREYGKSQDG